MSHILEDYQELLDELPTHAQELMRGLWPELARSLNSRGMAIFMQGVQALRVLGKGDALLDAWIRQGAELGRELGEEALTAVVQSAMRMASKTSGAVIEQVILSAPLAARRLGDLELFQGFLQLLEALLAQAPRGLRPMLEHLDQLLGQLTLGGLRRWALWGAQAHRTDFEGQIAYFSLQSNDARAMLQQERKGTLFIDVQRRIGMYLRALWGRDFFMRPTSGDFENRDGYRPWIENYVIHLPDALDDIDDLTGVSLYRAAATHAAAHLAHTRTALPAEGLTPLQMALIGLVEDARIEALAMQRFPGLKEIWLPQHQATPFLGETAGALMSRLARALIDPAYEDPSPWVHEGRAAFQNARDRLEDNQLAFEIGLLLAHQLMARAIDFHPRQDVVNVPYRDDNRFIWEFEPLDWERIALNDLKQVRRQVSVMEMVNALDVPGAGDDAQEIWTLSSEFFRDEEPTSVNEQEGKPPASPPFHYAEWDYQIQLERPSWCTLYEKRPSWGDVSAIHAIIDRNRPLVSRLKYLIEAMQPQGVQRLRKQEDGDDIDLEAAIRAMVDLRNGETPDPRINVRHIRRIRDLSVMVLLDLSESTNEKVRGSEQTVLNLAREATVLLADAMDRIGDPFAIHGFASDGRDDVEYYRFKDFEAEYDDKVRGRLAGMTGQLSTRMGAALRHAGHYLKMRPTSRKLLLVVTDGEPADVDVRDPQYLRQDARKAVEELARVGITTYCMSLDPNADDYVTRIFGARNYMVVDHVERLPERLPMLYMGLTR